MRSRVLLLQVLFVSEPGVGSARRSCFENEQRIECEEVEPAGRSVVRCKGGKQPEGGQKAREIVMDKLKYPRSNARERQDRRGRDEALFNCVHSEISASPLCPLGCQVVKVVRTLDTCCGVATNSHRGACAKEAGPSQALSCSLCLPAAAVSGASLQRKSSVLALLMLLPGHPCALRCL